MMTERRRYRRQQLHQRSSSFSAHKLNGTTLTSASHWTVVVSISHPSTLMSSITLHANTTVCHSCHLIINNIQVCFSCCKCSTKFHINCASITTLTFSCISLKFAAFWSHRRLILLNPASANGHLSLSPQYGFFTSPSTPNPDRSRHPLLRPQPLHRHQNPHIHPLFSATFSIASTPHPPIHRHVFLFSSRTSPSLTLASRTLILAK